MKRPAEMNQAQRKTPVDQRSLHRLRELVIAPSASISDAEERRITRLAATLLFLILFFEFLGGLARFALMGMSIVEAFSGPLGFTFIPTLAAYLIARTRYYSAAIFIFSLTYSATAHVSLTIQGEAADPALLILIYVVPGLIVASAFLSSGTVLVLTGVNLISFLVARSLSGPLSGESVVQAGMIAMTGFLLFLLAKFRHSIESSRLLQAQILNRELEDLSANLERRVEDRTRQLEDANQQVKHRIAQLQAVTELSETIAQLQDLNEIFPQATRLVNAYFGFYHVGIFLIDEAREYAVLQAANSEGGKRMLERNHRLRLGTGVVGYAALTGMPRIALDVGTDAVFFNNPDLPDTRSEVALPMKSRGEIIGILDVQSREAGAFSADDLQILTTLSNQVAIAIENARLLTEARAALMQVEEVYNEFTRSEWGRTIAKAEQPGFRYHGGRIEMLDKGWRLPEVDSAAHSGETVSGPAAGAPGRRNTVAVPVKLRGEVIGVIHVESDDPSRSWFEDEVSLVEAVAERAAFAMENARLFQDARRRAVKEQAISEATSRIGTALNIENILLTTAEELERVLGGSDISIRFQGRE